MKLPGIKRIFPLILTLLLLPALLAVPARADESDSYWINLLDYGYPSGYSSNFIPLTGSQVPINYNNPVGGPLDYVDILLRTDSTSFRVASWNAFLTTVDLGDGLYRVYGNLATGYSDATGEVFFRDYNGTYVEILSFKVSRYTSYRYEKICVGKVFDYSTSPATQSTVNYQGNGEPSNQIQFHSASYDQLTWLADLDIYQWQTMDYIQLSATSFCGSIDSISVTCNGVNVPFSYVPTTGDEKGGLTLAFIDLLIDVRNLDRIDSASTIVVKIVGSQSANKTGNFIIQLCHGIVAVDAPSTETFWFTKLINSISSGFTSVGTWISDQTSSFGTWISNQTTTIVTYFHNLYGWLSEHTGYITGAIATWGDVVRDAIESWGRNLQISVETWGQKIVDAISGTGDSSHVQNDIDSALGELGEIDSVMGSVNRPALDSISFDLSGMVSANAVTVYGSIFSTLIGNQYMSNILMMAFILAAASFLLFGRR